MPSSVSKIDSNARVSRFLRWNVIANRWASSRIRCKSWSPGSCRSSTIGADRPGTNTSSAAFRECDDGHARHLVRRLDRFERGGELPLAAVDHDEVRDCREALVVATRLGTVPQAGESPRDDLTDRGEIVLTVEAPHGERPVVRLLRLGVDAYRHRGDDVTTLQVGDVEALDADRQALEVEALAEALERLDSTPPLLFRGGRLVRQGELRVLRRERREPSLLAARRRPHLDRGPSQLREEAGECLGVGEVARDDQLRRHTGSGGVVLETEPLEDRRPVLPLHVLEVECVTVDQPTVAQREELHGRTVARHGEADHIHRSDVPAVGALPLSQALDREQPIAVARRVLEALLGGGLLHPLFE